MSNDERSEMVRTALATYFSVLGSWAEDFKRSIQDHDLYDENIFYTVIEQYTVTCVLDANPTATPQ